ncbi:MULTISPECIES: glycosyltransferase [unclassified Lysobacter]
MSIDAYRTPTVVGGADPAHSAVSGRLLGIVHVVDSLELGGLERVVTDLAIEQAAHGHRVVVLSIAAGGSFEADLDAAGVRVIVAGKRRTFDIGVLRALRRAVNGCDADVVHTHNFVPNYYAALALIWPHRRRHCRPVLVNTCHNMGSRLANRRLRWLYRLSLLRTARVAMVGMQVRERFVDRGIVSAERSAVVLNGIPTKRYVSGPAARAAARAVLGVAPDAMLIGSVGRLVALKNHRLLLDLMPALAATCPALQLALVGDGPLRAELEGLADTLGISDRVHFPGARNDVAQLLPAFDIFALPSLTEGLSIALLEACAAGLAIVATEVGGNPEIITDGHTGRLVPSDDRDATRVVMEDLLGDPGLRARLGMAARDWVRESGSIEAMRRSHDDLYTVASGHQERCEK